MLGVSVSALMVLVPPLGNGEPATGVKLPSAAISKASIRSDPALATNARLLAQVASTAAAAPLVRNGDPKTGVRPPLAAIVYTPTASIDLRPTRRNFPLAVTFTPSGNAPLSSGEPAASVSAPAGEMLNVWINVELSSNSNRKWPSGLAPKESVLPEFAAATVKGEPGTAVRFPVLGSIAKALSCRCLRWLHR